MLNVRHPISRHWSTSTCHCPFFQRVISPSTLLGATGDLWVLQSRPTKWVPAWRRRRSIICERQWFGPESSLEKPSSVDHATSSVCTVRDFPRYYYPHSCSSCGRFPDWDSLQHKVHSSHLLISVLLLSLHTTRRLMRWAPETLITASATLVENRSQTVYQHVSLTTKMYISNSITWDGVFLLAFSRSLDDFNRVVLRQQQETCAFIDKWTWPTATCVAA